MTGTSIYYFEPGSYYEVGYDYNGLQLDEETQNGYVIDRKYDSLGRNTGYDLYLPSDLENPVQELSYGYDDYGRFSMVTTVCHSSYSTVTNIFEYSRLENTDLISGYAGNIGGTASPLSVKRNYEPNRDLITTVSNIWDDSTISAFTYANDELGRRTVRDDYYVNRGSTIANSFSYNTFSEVTNALMGTSAYSYDYDPIGNRDSSGMDGQGTSYFPNNLNQYTNITGISSSLMYDADGNLLDDGTVSYTWDSRNNLTTWSNRNTGVWSENVYDHMSRRIASTTYCGTYCVETRKFVYDGWNLICEYLDDSMDIMHNYYTWGLDLSGTLQGAGGVGGLLVYRYNFSNDYFPLADANGNITEYIDSDNATVYDHYEYDPFGNTTYEKLNSYILKFRFSTKFFDSSPIYGSDFGLYYYGHRWCHTNLGRFLSRDPIEERGGINLYGFTKNNPIDFIDILGLSGFSLKWVDKGAVYDGNNLWVGVWLWPESPPKTGYVIAKIDIKEAELKKCYGTTVSGNLAVDNLVTLDRFLDSKFLAKYNPSENDDGIFRGGTTPGGGNFRNGIYYALINTKIFSDTSQGNGLVDCQKGKVVIEFSYNVSNGDYGDTGLDWVNPNDDNLPYKDFKSFTNEALHKPVRRPYDGDGYNYSEYSSKTITINWDWCNEANRKSKKVTKSPNLPRGPNRYGR